MQQDNYLPSHTRKSSKDVPVLCQWSITHWQPDTQEILHHEESENLIVKTGLDYMLRLLLGLPGSSFIAMGAGACSTPATRDDIRLNYEHILNPSRKTLTNVDGDPLDVTDILDDEYSVGDCDFFKKVTVRARYLTNDGNNGHPFQEYGLFTTTDLPPNPQAPSGVMYNHFVAAAPIVKDSSTEIIVDITIRV